MKQQNGFAPVLILVGILTIAAVVGGAYYFGYDHGWEKSVITSPSPSDANPVPNSTGANREPTGSTETANWKIYTNNGIYFKYPTDWSIAPYTSDTLITSNSPKIKLNIAPKNGTLMNECMQQSSIETKNNLTIKKFTRVTTGAMCSGSDSDLKEIWVIPSQDAYSPGISYQYSAAEASQAEQVFNQILSTFRFD